MAAACAADVGLEPQAMTDMGRVPSVNRDLIGIHIEQASSYERHVVEWQPRSCVWQGAARVFRCVIPGKRIESLNKLPSAKMVVGVHPCDCSGKLDIGAGCHLYQAGNCHLYGFGMARSVR